MRFVREVPDQVRDDSCCSDRSARRFCPREVGFSSPHHSDPVAVGVNDHFAVFLGEGTGGPLINQVQNLFARATEGGALWCGDEGAVYEDGVLDHRFDEGFVIEINAEFEFFCLISAERLPCGGACGGEHGAELAYLPAFGLVVDDFGLVACGLEDRQSVPRGAAFWVVGDGYGQFPASIFRGDLMG